jgi:hypothetical protein
MLQHFADGWSKLSANLDLVRGLILLPLHVCGLTRMPNSSGTGTQTLCATGTVYPSIGATQGVTNVQCWPSWDGTNWNATRGLFSSPTCYYSY